MNISETQTGDEKSDIKETELTFYKTLANSPETKNIQQQENIPISKKSEPVYPKSAENKIAETKSQKKQTGVIEIPQNVPVAVDEEDKAVEVDSKFGHLNIASNNKKTEAQNEALSTDQKRDLEKVEFVHKEETVPKIAVETSLRTLPDNAGLPTKKPEKELVLEKKAGGNLYTVQVASFTSKDEAFNLKNKLEKKGFDSYIVLFMKGEVKWFRVRVGSLNTKEEASQISKKIKEEIKLNSFVTSYER
jgi:cell division septation protein DedD